MDKVLGTENPTLLEIRIMRSMLNSLEQFIENFQLQRGKDSEISFIVFPSNKLRLEIQNAGGPTLETYELYLQMQDRAMEILADNTAANNDPAEQQQQKSSAGINAIRLLQFAIRVLFGSQAAGKEPRFRTVIQQTAPRRG